MGQIWEPKPLGELSQCPLAAERAPSCLSPLDVSGLAGAINSKKSLIPRRKFLKKPLATSNFISRTIGFPPGPRACEPHTPLFFNLCLLCVWEIGQRDANVPRILEGMISCWLQNTPASLGGGGGIRESSRARSSQEWAIGRVWSLGVHQNSQGVAGGTGSAQLPQSPERASSSCLGDREGGLGFLL